MTETAKNARLAEGDVPYHGLLGSRYVEIADEYWTGTPKQMHKRAAAIMKVFGPVMNAELGEVHFSKVGRKKTLFDKRTPHEFQSVSALPELTRRGKVVSSIPDRKGRGGVMAFHKLEHGLKIGEAKYRVEITVKQTTDGPKRVHQFYLHRLRNEEASSLSSRPSLRRTASPAGQDTI
jgi:Large polyvalent protein-associated domain 3